MVTGAVGAAAAAWTWLAAATARTVYRPTTAGRQRAMKVPPAPATADAAATQPAAGSRRWIWIVPPAGTSGSTPRKRMTLPASAPGSAVRLAPAAGAWAPAAGAQASTPHKAAQTSSAVGRQGGFMILVQRPTG